MTVKCGSLETDDIDDDISVEGYSDPAVEGTTVMLQCLLPGHQLQLVGPNTTTCMGNGEWKPDPREATCLGMNQSKIVFTSLLALTLVYMRLRNNAADCGVLTVGENNIVNFEVVYNSTLEGSMIIFSCGESEFTSVCQETGRWSPHPTEITLCSTGMLTNTKFNNGY